MRFETFVRKLRHLKYLHTRFDRMNDGFTKLLCSTDMSDRIYVHAFDEVFDLTLTELIKDIEDDLLLPSDNDSVICAVDYLVYDAEFGTKGSYSFDENTYDTTVWNVYADLYGVLNPEVADTLKNPKVVI